MSPIISSIHIFLIVIMLTVGQSAHADQLDIVGTGDGMAILQNLADAFKKEHPQHSINIPESIGSSGGIKSVGNNKHLLGRVARPIKEREKVYGLSYLPIARFPVVFFVNPDVIVDDLAQQQILDIYSGKVNNWETVGGADAKIRVVRREEGDSSLRILRKTLPGFSDIAITPLSKTTTFTQENLEFINQKSGTIGFGPYADALIADVKILSIAHLQPTDDAYPSHGVLALIFKSNHRRGIVAAFIEFVFTPSGMAAIRSGHGIPYRKQGYE